MKNCPFLVHLILTVLLSQGCGPSDSLSSLSDECKAIEFNEDFSFKEKDVFCLNDNYEITFLKVEGDVCSLTEYCPYDVLFIFEISIQKDGVIEQYTFYDNNFNSVDFPFDLEFEFLELESNYTITSFTIDATNLIFKMRFKE